MVHSCTSFGKLKRAVVGRELQIPERTVDLTFRNFYREAIGQKLYDENVSEYRINSETLAKRAEQLDGLADTLEKLGVEVLRPDEAKRVSRVKTPFFESETSSASNVRDLAIVYGDKLVETPPFVRNRYFEELNLRRVFREAAAGSQWIRAPQTSLDERSMDLEDWWLPRDFSQEPDPQYEMAIDGAQFLRLGRDCVVNVATWNHKLGLEWMRPFFPDAVFHQVKWADNHLDGLIASLAPRVFLVSPAFTNAMLFQLPEKFHSCEFICSDYVEPRDVRGLTDAQIQLASSRGMDVNVLSVDECTVLVNKLATGVAKKLEARGFNVVLVELEACELFGGGLHCSTLDLNREDSYEHFT